MTLSSFRSDKTVAIHAILKNSIHDFGFTNGRRTFELDEVDQEFEAATGTLPAYLKLSKTIQGKIRSSLRHK